MAINSALPQVLPLSGISRITSTVATLENTVGHGLLSLANTNSPAVDVTATAVGTAAATVAVSAAQGAARVHGMYTEIVVPRDETPQPIVYTYTGARMIKSVPGTELAYTNTCTVRPLRTGETCAFVFFFGQLTESARYWMEPMELFYDASNPIDIQVTNQGSSSGTSHNHYALTNGSQKYKIAKDALQVLASR